MSMTADPVLPEMRTHHAGDDGSDRPAPPGVDGRGIARVAIRISRHPAGRTRDGARSHAPRRRRLVAIVLAVTALLAAIAIGLNRPSRRRRWTNNPFWSSSSAGYRVITLNRPQRLNAFTEAMHQALRDCARGCGSRRDVPRLAAHRRRPRFLRRPGPQRSAVEGRRDAGARRRARGLLQSADPEIARAAVPRGRGRQRRRRRRRLQHRAGLRHRPCRAHGDLRAVVRQDRSRPRFRRHLDPAAPDRPGARPRAGADRRAGAGREGGKLGHDLEGARGRRTHVAKRTSSASTSRPRRRSGWR